MVESRGASNQGHWNRSYLFPGKHMWRTSARSRGDNQDLPGRKQESKQQEPRDPLANASPKEPWISKVQKQKSHCCSQPTTLSAIALPHCHQKAAGWTRHSGQATAPDIIGANTPPAVYTLAPGFIQIPSVSNGEGNGQKRKKCLAI